jgi:hypothetical protein
MADTYRQMTWRGFDWTLHVELGYRATRDEPGEPDEVVGFQCERVADICEAAGWLDVEVPDAYDDDIDVQRSLDAHLIAVATRFVTEGELEEEMYDLIAGGADWAE